MSAHTEHQIIIQNGEPAFAVIPWVEYQELIHHKTDPDDPYAWFPNDVVKANSRGESLIKAWREHFGLTQAELAAKSVMQQPSFALLESNDSIPRITTLTKLAKAMNVGIEQLIE